MRTRRVASVSLCLSLAAALLALLPSFAADSLSSAISLYEKKDYVGAAIAFRKLSQSADRITATYYLALCYQQMRQDAPAADLFRYICKYYPGTPEAKHAADYLKQLSTGGSAGGSASSSAPAALNVSSGNAQHKGDQDSEPVLTRAEWEALPARVRIPIAREHGHLMVNAKINGKFCKVAFDTGATVSGISLFDYPDILSQDELDKAKTVPVSRPHGVVPVKDCIATITLQDLTRRVRFLALNEEGVSVIGQNFFKDYNYEIDDFYVRLTKAPFPGSEAVASAKPSAASAAQGAAHTPKTDKYSVPFETSHDVMFINIEINGVKTKACFDTGCAPDGIVCHPSYFDKVKLHLDNDGNAIADRLVIGHIIKTNVKAYPAAGLEYPLLGPKIFGRPFKVDQKEKVIRFDW